MDDSEHLSDSTRNKDTQTPEWLTSQSWVDISDFDSSWASEFARYFHKKQMCDLGDDLELGYADEVLIRYEKGNLKAVIIIDELADDKAQAACFKLDKNNINFVDSQKKQFPVQEFDNLCKSVGDKSHFGFWYVTAERQPGYYSVLVPGGIPPGKGPVQ